MNTQENTDRIGLVLDRKRLAQEAKNLDAVTRIGKNGLTPSVIEEIILQLKQKRLIKIKLLKAFLEGKDKKALAQDIANKTNAVLVQQVGFVVVLYKGNSKSG